MQLLLIDNDKAFVKTLSEYITHYFSNQFIIRFSSSLNEAEQHLSTSNFHLVITETVVDEKPIFDFLKQKEKQVQHILFISNNEHLAFAGYRIKNVLGYELKPVTKEVIQKHILQSIFGNHFSYTETNLIESRKIFVANSRDELVLINKENIIRFESNRTDILLISKHFPPLPINSTLKVLEHMLYRKLFVRAHQSHLINLNAVKQFLLSRNTLKMINGDSVPVSQRKKRHILKALKKWYLFE